MGRDGFSRYHPAVNFLFFLGAIGFGVVIQHPVYLLGGVACAAVYYLMLKGRRGIGFVLGMLPVTAVIGFVNPLLNTRGRTVLFSVFDRPYTLESLYYGLALGAVFVIMMLWFGAYNQVLTSDKFVCLFGRLMPSLSLLLVMVLRLIPSFTGKTKQITAARTVIGRGANPGATFREKLASGGAVLSALTDWALEGSIVTADSMRARGYGTARRTSYRVYRMTARDWVMLALEAVLGGMVLLAVITGRAEASYAYRVTVAPLTWHFFAYLGFLLIPVGIEIKEAVQWRIILWKI